MVALAVLIVVAAIGRFSDPPDIDGAGVLAVGAFGLAGNAWATLVLARGERSDINLEAVLRHSAADALGSIAVVLSGLAILAFGWLEADPIASLAIAGLILASSVRLVREPLDVLMESAPPGVDIEELGAEVCRVEGVRSVHELHVWTVTSGFEALAAHIVTAPGVDRDRARREVEYLLRDRFGIEHTTLQMEEAVDGGELLQVDLQGS
jgi:cobalt-zinc-cadmium efflux system protein